MYYVEALKTLHSEYADPEYRNTVLPAGRPSSDTDGTHYAYSGGTIVNRLVGTVNINGRKAWNNISSKLQKQYYPVAYFALYRKDKGVTYTQDTTQTPYGFDRVDASMGECVSETALYSGQESYAFPNTSAPQSFPKYDQNGAFIKYIVSERTINGYSNNLDNENIPEVITNDYDGGEKLNFHVTKSWENRNEQEFPTVRILLLQMIRLDDNTYIEYNRFEHILRSGANSCDFNNLEKIDPRGNEFIYEFREIMTNYAGESTQEIALTDQNGIPLTGNQIQRGMGYQCFMTITDTDAHTKTAAITNRYQPDEDDFKSTVNVSKHWELYNFTHKTQYQRGFAFTLKRFTPRIGEKNLFKVEVNGQRLVQNSGGVYEVVFDQTPQLILDGITDQTMTIEAVEGYRDGNNKPVFVPTGEKQYRTVIIFTKSIYTLDRDIEVTIDVDLTESTDYRIRIDGLAVFGQDGVRYTYQAVEDNIPGFTRYLRNDTDESAQQLAVSNGRYQASLSLFNKADTASIGVVQFFGALLENGTVEKLPVEDHAQFFDNAYRNQLRYTIRAVSPNTDANNDFNLSFTIAGNNLVQEGTEAQGTEVYHPGDGTGYYYYSKDSGGDRLKIPVYDPLGAPYQFIVEETNKGGTNVNVYGNTNRSAFNNAISAVPESQSVTLNQSGSALTGGTAYFENAFPAKRITVSKYWEDAVDVVLTEDDPDTPEDETTTQKVYHYDGMRPEILPMTIEQTFTDSTPAKTFTMLLTNSGGWTKNNVYFPRMVYFSGGELPVDKLELSEDLNAAINYADYSGEYPELEGKTYAYGSLANAKYRKDNARSVTELDLRNSTYTPGAPDEELKLTNTKEPVKGTLTVTKNWDDQNNAWDTRPSSIILTPKYQPEGTTGALQTAVYYDGRTIPASVYTLSRAAQNQSVTIGDLPLGQSVGATAQSNGTFTPYVYTAEESSGNAGFVRTYAIGAVKKGDTEVVDGEALVQDSSDYSKASLSLTITNTLRTVKHQVNKTWDDSQDYYHTRKNMTIQLERTTTPETDSSWQVVTFPENTTEFVINASDKQMTRTDSRTPVDTFTDIGPAVFDTLPVFDQDGNQYYYRTREIRLNAVSRTGNDIANYSVDDTDYSNVTVSDENNELTITGTSATNITNTLVLTEYKHYVVKKVWGDNNNQDGRRLPVKVKRHLYQYDVAEVTDSSLGTLTELNGYTNPYPQQRSYTTSSATVETTDPADNEKIKTVTFTNTYEPLKRSVTVTKTWDDSNNTFGLRPDAVQFELYCKYGTGENAREGPASGLLSKAYYLDTATNTKKYLTADNYDFVRTADSAHGYSVTFENLPVWYNPGGTATGYGDSNRQAGTSQLITYYVREKVPQLTAGGYSADTYQTFEQISRQNGYLVYPYLPEDYVAADRTAAGKSQEVNLQSSDGSIGFTNSLNTHEIVVAKSWSDGGYPAVQANALHYNVDITLSHSSAPAYTSPVRTLVANSGKVVSFTGLPKYDATGHEIIYNVTEAVSSAVQGTEVNGSFQSGGTETAAGVFTVSSQQYGYVGRCRYQTDNEGLTSQYNITNTLPVMRFKASKLWDDDNNRDGLRTAVTLYLNRDG